MSTTPTKLGAALFAALTLALGACSNGSGPSTTTLNTLSTIQSQDLAQDAAEDVDEMADASSFPGI